MNVFSTSFFQGMQIYMQCDNGEIEVFLCPEEETMGINGGGGGAASSSEDNTDTESEASPMKHHQQQQRLGLPPPSPPPRLDIDEESRSSEIGQIRNVLISASEDFGPVGRQLQLQTLDQEHRKFHFSCLHVKITPVATRRKRRRRRIFRAAYTTELLL